MKNTVDEQTTRRSIAPKYDELYNEPNRAARGIVVGFWMVVLIWGLLIGAWWAVHHHKQ